MSYDLHLGYPISGNTLELDEPHHMRDETYAVRGTLNCWISITYNYAGHFYRLFPVRDWREGDSKYDKDKSIGGIRVIYGMSGAESIPVLQAVIDQLGDDVDPDYWKATEGNAKRALLGLLALATMRPDGIWSGD